MKDITLHDIVRQMDDISNKIQSYQDKVNEQRLAHEAALRRLYNTIRDYTIITTSKR